MDHLIGPEGQVVIPEDLRAELDIKPGDHVTFRRDGDHIAIHPQPSTRPLRGRFKNEPLLELPMEEKARDREGEDRHG